MTTDEQREPSRERRATDGLDWRQTVSPPPEAPLPPRQQGQDSAGAQSRLPALAWIGLTALAAALIGGLAGAGLVVLVDDEDTSGSATPASTGDTTRLTVEQTGAVVDAAARIRPSVVRIDSTRRPSGTAVDHDIGSGVILDRDGHILTNAHVVLNTESLKVVFSDGTERPAILLGHDFPFTDLAVLQVGPGNIQPVEAGDSAALRLGETVIAVGNPLAEFDGTVTVGVVSGLERRRVFDQVRQDDLIQTDAAINVGNSGGALANLRGQFIGMPTAIVRQTRGGLAIEAIGFAIPANRAIAIAKAIIDAGGSYPRPTLGIEHVDISAEVLLRQGRLPLDEGGLVMAIQPGGPAASAGIAAGDIITRIGDQDVNKENPLLNALQKYQPGSTVKVVFNRNGRIIEAEVRLAQRS